MCVKRLISLPLILIDEKLKDDKKLNIYMYLSNKKIACLN
jgi:hypothetical protein